MLKDNHEEIDHEYKLNFPEDLEFRLDNDFEDYENKAYPSILVTAASDQREERALKQIEDAYDPYDVKFLLTG